MRDLSKPLAPTYGDPVKKMKKKATPSQRDLRAATSKAKKVFNAYGKEVTQTTHMKGKKKQDGYNDAMEKRRSDMRAIKNRKKK